jgi:adenylylsulfate reductase subunit B
VDHQIPQREHQALQVPIRTTPEGSIKPYDGKPEGGSLEDELLFTETKLIEPKETVMKTFSVTDADTVQCWLDGFCK